MHSSEVPFAASEQLPSASLSTRAVSPVPHSKQVLEACPQPIPLADLDDGVERDLRVRLEELEDVDFVLPAAGNELQRDEVRNVDHRKAELAHVLCARDRIAR